MSLSKKIKGRTGDVYDRDCPSRLLLDHVTSRWGLLVLIVLLDGTMRFSELVRKVTGVSEKMMAQTLHLLEADGIVLRVVYPTVPPKVEYSLTPLGREVAAHVEGLTAWVEENLPRVVQHRARQEKRALVAVGA